VLQIVSTGRGRNVLFFPSAEGRINIATHSRSDRVQTGGDAQAYYLAQLRSLATVQRRIAGARQLGPLLGVRRIANRYLEAGGPGWVLVGDALHHKDPVDGQGIYDALVEARHLATLLGEHAHDRIGWDDMLARYHRATVAATHRMFEATMERLKRDLYTDLPPLMIKTLARWSLQDPEYQRRFLLVLARAMPPDGWRTPAFMARVAARGLLRDLRALLPTTANARTHERRDQAN
jgi:2-polyprenyl-6-methoxyphenol hydroxylase-like FAD-dependent oxidoreductase